MLPIGTYTMVYLSNNKPRYNDADRAVGFESLVPGLQYASVRDRSHPNPFLTRLGAPFLLVYGPHDVPDTRYPPGARSGV